MYRMGTCMKAVLAVGVLCLAPVARSEAPAASPTGEAVVASKTVTATVANIDPKTREITLKTEDGKEHSFVAGDAVKNFGQIHKGDMVTATYAEALAFEVKKGGTMRADETVMTESAKPGEMPAGVIARKTTVTVAIVAIDPDLPSVTFKGPAGNTRTVKVLHPERLKGVSVGDTVDITYTEALAMKVEPAPKK